MRGARLTKVRGVQGCDSPRSARAQDCKGHVGTRV